MKSLILIISLLGYQYAFAGRAAGEKSVPVNSVDTRRADIKLDLQQCLRIHGILEAGGYRSDQNAGALAGCIGRAKASLTRVSLNAQDKAQVQKLLSDAFAQLGDDKESKQIKQDIRDFLAEINGRTTTATLLPAEITK